MNLETEIYQILKKHRLSLKKREELIVDLLDFINKREKAITVTRCCKSDSELLQAYKKDDIVLLDNKVKVRVIIPEPKVLIDEEESGCKMWVETKRLVKQK